MLKRSKKYSWKAHIAATKSSYAVYDIHGWCEYIGVYINLWMCQCACTVYFMYESVCMDGWYQMCVYIFSLQFEIHCILYSLNFGRLNNVEKLRSHNVGKNVAAVRDCICDTQKLLFFSFYFICSWNEHIGRHIVHVVELFFWYSEFHFNGIKSLCEYIGWIFRCGFFFFLFWFIWLKTMIMITENCNHIRGTFCSCNFSHWKLKKMCVNASFYSLFCICMAYDKSCFILLSIVLLSLFVCVSTIFFFFPHFVVAFCCRVWFFCICFLQQSTI